MKFLILAASFLALACLLDAGTTGLVLATNAGVEANPIFALSDTALEAAIFFGFAPMAAVLFLLPLARLLTQASADSTMLRPRALLTTSRLNPTLTAFLLATIAAAIALAKLIFAMSNLGVLITGEPLLPVRHFGLSLLSVATAAIIVSPFAIRALLLLSERRAYVRSAP